LLRLNFVKDRNGLSVWSNVHAGSELNAVDMCERQIVTSGQNSTECRLARSRIADDRETFHWTERISHSREAPPTSTCATSPSERPTMALPRGLTGVMTCTVCPSILNVIPPPFGKTKTVLSCSFKWSSTSAPAWTGESDESDLPSICLQIAR